VTLPILKKLKKCRDPDRANFAALEKVRREKAMAEAESDDDGGAGGTIDDDAAIFGDAPAPNAKRRKVANEDPFGPAM
jgi:cyclin H